MPVLGMDPDKVTAEWYEWDEVYAQSPNQRTFIRSPQIREVVNHFAYHPKMSMNQRFDEESQTVMAAWVSRRIRSGYTVKQLKQAINRFFVSWAKDFDVPAYGIVSNDMQDRLFEGERTHHADPILEWIVNGMDDTGPFDDPRGVRSLLLLRCHEGALRYPDVVVNVLKSAGSMSYIGNLLDALEYIIRWKTRKEDDRAQLYQAQRDLKAFDLPVELTSGLHNRLTPASETMTKAIIKSEGRRGKRTD